jgi:release factor glutamine methyltransferase
MTPRRLLARAAGLLQSAGCASPRLDAELLLCHVLERPRSWLVAHADDALATTQVTDFHGLLARREAREPLAYITGEKEFWSRGFRVTPDVLIPRPETEHLVEAVLTHFPDREKPWRFCDIGTGSGCLAVTLACEYPRAVVTATDLSAAALDVARSNAERHGTAGRIDFHAGDLFAALASGSAPFDAIVSNPPYIGIAEMDALEPELDFEPHHALYDNQDGLSLLQQLVAEAGHWLSPHGALIVETGICGLPEEIPTSDAGVRLVLQQRIFDLSGQLRGGVYHHQDAGRACPYCDCP